MKRLSTATLGRLPADVKRPAYDRSLVTTGIVHLGIGAFHRGHQAVYTDDVLEAGDLGWGIVGASLRSPDTRDALEPQDGLYALDMRDGSGDRIRVIGAISGVLVATEAPSVLLDALCEPGVRIGSLTVTEKGYCHSPATGELDEAHPDIVHDLAHPDQPRSAPGFIVEAIARRRSLGLPAFTVLSCDNLPANGRTVKRVLTRLATLRDPGLGRFVADHVACPSSMVDRIVPSTTDADRDRIASHLGVEDRWPVMAEPFTQWVIEDDFPAGRPNWVGPTYVADVEPFELMKLRLLNGSHSTLAYLGYLAGHETVADAMGDPNLVKLVAALMDEEVTPTLHPLQGFDLTAYKAQLLERFRNPALRHRTWQIAMDGSQKLPQRLLATIRDRLSSGGSVDRLALGVAAWMRYVAGTDEAGRPIDVRDPLAAALRARADAASGDAEQLATNLLGLTTIFGADLPGLPDFTVPLRRAIGLLATNGAARTAALYAETGSRPR